MAAFQLAERGELSARQRARFVRETRAYLRERDRLDLGDRKRAIKAAERRQREAIRTVVKRCKLNRGRVRNQVKAYRQTERERINREVAEMRDKARRVCDARKQAVRRAGLSVRARKEAELEAERRLQGELARAAKHAEQRKAKFQRSAREVQAESDDHVRANIDAELLPVFERVKRSIRGDAHKSRTEAFLEFVESNPADVLVLQQEAADTEVRRLLAEQAKHEREAAQRRKRNYKPSAAELAEYLAEVPF
jgi:hypothetical protein